MSVLDIEGLDAVYGSLQALWGVSLEVQPGQVTVIAGPNGAGKSTLMAAVAGTVKSPAGTVRVCDEDVTSKGYAARMRAGLAWVPEGRNMFAHLSVRDNLSLSAWLAGTRKELPQIEESIFDLFPIVKERYDQKAGTLSGGQQQIVALARALVRRPQVALLDEPTVGLAPSIVDRLADAIERTSERGIAWVVAEQNLAWLEPIADAVYTMRGGHLTYTGGAEVLSSRELVRSAFFEG